MNLYQKFVTNDPKKISWSRKLKRNLGNSASISHDENAYRHVIYRPFSPSNLYFNEMLIEETYNMARFYS